MKSNCHFVEKEIILTPLIVKKGKIPTQNSIDALYNRPVADCIACAGIQEKNESIEKIQHSVSCRFIEKIFIC